MLVYDHKPPGNTASAVAGTFGQSASKEWRTAVWTNEPKRAFGGTSSTTSRHLLWDYPAYHRALTEIQETSRPASFYGWVEDHGDKSDINQRLLQSERQRSREVCESQGPWKRSRYAKKPNRTTWQEPLHWLRNSFYCSGQTGLDQLKLNKLKGKQMLVNDVTAWRRPSWVSIASVSAINLTITSEQVQGFNSFSRHSTHHCRRNRLSNNIRSVATGAAM